MEFYCISPTWDTSNLGTETALNPQKSLLGKHHPPDLVLTELALLGLGQGLPAPGPLTKGEKMETMKKVLWTPRGWCQLGQNKRPEITNRKFFIQAQ